MRAIDEYTPDWNVEDDELIRRLRGLQWAPVSDAMRERCWREFSERLERRSAAEERPKRATTNLSDRYDCRRFVPSARLAVAQAAARRHTPRTAFSVT